ncbi:MAG: Fic family protein [Oceanobacter sp.]
MGRYRVDGSEGDYQPGSDNLVLKNSLGLTFPADINDAETELLQALYLHVFDTIYFPETVDCKVLCEWHRIWLGNLYPWAGELRTVNMSKGEFHFAAASLLAGLMSSLEQNYLSHFEHLPSMSDQEIIHFFTESHVEFILVHPFREGNGRLSRLLLDVMAVKAGFEPLDYTLWDQHKDFYIKAIQAGVSGEYQYMARLVEDVLNQQ